MTLTETSVVFMGSLCVFVAVKAFHTDTSASVHETVSSDSAEFASC